MSPTRADVLSVINAAPHGLTSRELAERFGYPLQGISSKASKLAAWGIIDKVTIRDGNGKALWMRKDSR